MIILTRCYFVSTWFNMQTCRSIFYQVMFPQIPLKIQKRPQNDPEKSQISPKKRPNVEYTPMITTAATLPSSLQCRFHAKSRIISSLTAESLVLVVVLTALPPTSDWLKIGKFNKEIAWLFGRTITLNHFELSDEFVSTKIFYFKITLANQLWISLN